MSIVLSLYPKKFGYSLGGYSHWERCRTPDRKKSTKEGWEVAMKNQLVDKWFRNNRLHFVNNKLRLYCRQNKDRLLPSGAIYEELKRITRLFHILKQSNKAATYDSQVASSRQNLNTVVKIYHKGKTPGSILCGPVYAHRCALLVLISIYDAKKIPVDALGTLRTTGIHSL
jgi:hypothetical protein